MSTHVIHSTKETFYFVTFTCYRWLTLFEATSIYAYLPFWFSKMKEQGCVLNGYVIMPNHLHMILYVSADVKEFSMVISEAKRFLAYEIVKRLKSLGRDDLLKILSDGVQEMERKKGKRHQVFRLSFDAKELYTLKDIEGALDYIHGNPVSGKWKLVDDFTLFPYSSARFYEFGELSDIEVIDFHQMGE